MTNARESAPKGTRPVWMSEHEKDRLNCCRGGPYVVDLIGLPNGGVYVRTRLGQVAPSEPASEWLALEPAATRPQLQ